MGILSVLQQATLPSFGMTFLNSQLTVYIRSSVLFIFFCHHMECLLFSDLRIFSLSFPLCEWLTSTPFLLLVYYLFFRWIFAVSLVWCLGIKFHKWLLDFICQHILHIFSFVSFSSENWEFSFWWVRGMFYKLKNLASQIWKKIFMQNTGASLKKYHFN